jgi:hypothetical protein
MYGYFVQLHHHQFIADKMISGEAMHALMPARTRNLGIQLKLQWNIASVPIYLHNISRFIFYFLVYLILTFICNIVKQTHDKLHKIGSLLW